MSARSTKPSSAFALWRLALAYQITMKRAAANPPDQGLSLIECLVAIIIITLTVIAITPPIFLATATRIQSRRADQANQIAQKEVDRIRGIVERGVYTLNELPESIGSPSPAAFPSQAVPDKSLATSFSSPATCAGKTPYPQATVASAKSLIPVDVDGDCDAEYAMQVFRTDGCVPQDLQGKTPPEAPYSFQLGVRVYTHVPNETLPELGIERATLALTQGRRDLVTGNTRLPLQTLYTKLSRSNTSKALECAAQ